MPGPLMIDIAGFDLDDDDKRLLANEWVGGVILFSRNYRDKAQLAALCAQIRDCAAREILIAVDQEGGRVQRFKHEFSVLPAVRTIASYCQAHQLHASVVAKDLAWLMAQELIESGVDMSFAPVLDLANADSQVIGDRAFHEQVDTVIDLSKAYIAGMHDAGMKATGKHFPGHGSALADSHVELPVDERKLSTIFSADGRVFEQLAQDGIDAMMMAHVLFPQIDSDPVGFSSRWIKDILIEHIGFEGVIISDDLSMEGAACMGSFVERFEASLKAGCHMVLICNNRAEVLDVIANTTFNAIDWQQESLLKLRAEPGPVDTDRLSRVRALAQAMNTFND